MAALHTGSDAAPPVPPAGPALPVQPGMLRHHVLQVSDRLLCPYSVSLIVPGAVLEQLQVVCSKMIRAKPSVGGGGSWAGGRCCESLLGTGQWAFSELLFGLEKVQGVSEHPGQGSEPCDGHMVSAGAVLFWLLAKSCSSM